MRTKIICTLGPASNTLECIKDLISSGVEIFRLNFSHGTHETHQHLFSLIQKASHELNKTVGVLQDLEGYKIRTGLLKNNEEVSLSPGDVLNLTTRQIEGNKNNVHVSYDSLPSVVKPGNSVFIDDGKIELCIEAISGTEIKTIVVIGGRLGERKGVHIPGVDVELPPLTEKDIKDVHFGIKLGVDYIAQSFVSKARDILLIKDILKSKDAGHISVIAKIEDPQGVRNIDEIIRVSDGVMVARGDLGVSIPMATVPLVQKMIIEKCNKAGKPVITATQMLDSMIRNPHPTRAEVTDVANAVIDGTDAIMLSGETAVGLYPINSVKAMRDIAVTTEASLRYRELLSTKGISPGETIPEAIGYAARELAQLIKADAIITFTNSGNTARIVSRLRPQPPIIVVTSKVHVAQQLIPYWGTHIICGPEIEDVNELFDHYIKKAMELKLIKKGDTVVITGGVRRKLEGNTIKVVSV